MKVNHVEASVLDTPAIFPTQSLLGWLYKRRPVFIKVPQNRTHRLDHQGYQRYGKDVELQSHSVNSAKNFIALMFKHFQDFRALKRCKD